MKKIKGYIILAFIVITILFIVCIFEIKDQYDKELTELRLNNKKLSYELKRKKKDNQMMSLAIESLLDQVNGKKVIECDLGVQEYENGYIIDGYYYELKEQVGEE